jgi:hypothetical protein
MSPWGGPAVTAGTRLSGRERIVPFRRRENLAMGGWKGAADGGQAPVFVLPAPQWRL